MYCSNNPLKLIDPTGLYDIGGDNTGHLAYNNLEQKISDYNSEQSQARARQFEREVWACFDFDFGQGFYNGAEYYFGQGDIGNGLYWYSAGAAETIMDTGLMLIGGHKAAVIVGAIVTNGPAFFSRLFTPQVSGACFTKGTLVSTENGFIPIEDINVGDIVYAFNEETGESGFKKVVRTFVHEVNELIIIEVSGETIHTTEEHPFWVPEKGWVLAGELSEIDSLLLYTGEIVGIDKISTQILDNSIKVYNFEVEDWHTYYVTESKVTVHNKAMKTTLEVTSSIKNDPGLIKAAEQMGKNPVIQREADHLVQQFINGNANPGIGSKALFHGINYLRGRNGARVFYRMVDGVMDIVGKSNKANEQAVINTLKKIYE